MSIIPVFIPHAGCPHQCVFCNQQAISGQGSAAVTAAREQLKKWLGWTKPDIKNEAAFYGGSFTGLKYSLQEDLLALTDELLENGVIGSVRVSTRPDYIDEERLSFLKKHHVRLVELGVQSLDDEVLRLSERGHDAECVFRAVSLLRSSGFQVGLQLMVGMPGQDFASVIATAKRAAELRPDVIRIYPLLVIKDTPLEKLYKEGSFIPLTLNEAVKQSAYIYKKMIGCGAEVIRIGLQPDSELCSDGNIIAGPFHPSMGELVKSFVVRRELDGKIREAVAKGHKEMFILCEAGTESKVRGLRNSNTVYWRDQFPMLRINIIEESSRRAQAVVLNAENVIKYSDRNSDCMKG